MNKDKNSIVSPRGAPPVVDTTSQQPINNPTQENQQHYLPQYGYQYAQPLPQYVPQYTQQYAQPLPQYVPQYDYAQPLPQYLPQYTQQYVYPPQQYFPQYDYTQQLPQYLPQYTQQYVYPPQQYFPQYVQQLPYYAYNYVGETTVDKNSSFQEQLM